MAVDLECKIDMKVFSDVEELSRKCAEIFVSDAKEAVKAKGVFFCAISGGQTPRIFFKLLAELPAAETLSWDKIHIFWVDERCVAHNSEWSNYKLAYDTFLSLVNIPQENVHWIPTDLKNFEEAARCYEKEIRQTFGVKENQMPKFDLVILGVGVDGHIASLFPNSYAVFNRERLACVVYVLDEKLNRITLTHPVLCAANHLAVLISGKEKADILKRILTTKPDEVLYPVHLLWPVLDKVSWLVDKKAAKLLQD